MKMPGSDHLLVLTRPGRSRTWKLRAAKWPPHPCICVTARRGGGNICEEPSVRPLAPRLLAAAQSAGAPGARLCLAVSFLAVSLIAAATPRAALAGGCPNEQLRAENNSTQLPKCRAYELVTPGDHNAQGNVLGLVGQAVSPDGSAVSVQSITQLPGSPVGGQEQVIARRTSDGWIMAPAEPANDQPENVHALTLGAVGDDFSTVFLGDDADLVTGDQDVNIDDVFAVGTEGEIAWISQGSNGGIGEAPSGSTSNGNSELADAVGGSTPNLSHVVFQTPFGHLMLQDTHEYGDEIYDRVNGTSTNLVGVLPGETVPMCGASLGGEQPSGEGAGDYNSVSTSAETVFFESPDPSRLTLQAECPVGDREPSQLYVRINHETIPLSGSGSEAFYEMATSEGGDVVFRSGATLTPDANVVSGSRDLYEYDVATKTLSDISSEGLADPQGSRVLGVLGDGLSDNGEIIYFAAEGKLTSQAAAGKDNLYVSDDGHLSYIATLGPSDRNDWQGLIQSRDARATTNGLYLLFSSTERLTGYSDAGYAELYRYTLGQTGLTCISCGATETSATGTARVGGEADAAFPPDANMTPDGNTIVFSLAHAVDGEELNGVYEWHEGTTSLIATAGKGVNFVGASTDGSNVFFESYESLVPEDETGGEAEIYDARIDGGFPNSPPSEKQCESNSECRDAGTSLSTLSVASTTPGAIGNLSPAAPSTETALRITGHSAKAISVRTPSAGTLTLSGAGVTAAKKTASKAGSYTLPVTLTKAEHKLLAKRGRLTLSVTVRFVPTLGKTSTATAKLTIKKTKPKAKTKSKKN